MLYQLMNKDVVVATYEEVPDFDDFRYVPVTLKDFTYENPGLGCPAWKLDAVNRLKDRQIAALLE